MLILNECLTNFFIFFNEYCNETELLINRSLQIKIKYQIIFCGIVYLMSYQTDQTELEIVNFIKICSEN